MAATTVNLSRSPIARPASVDPCFGGTLAVGQIRVTGPGHFSRDGYLVFGAKPGVSQISVYEVWPDVSFRGEVLGELEGKSLIVGEQTVAASGDVTAATWSRVYSAAQRSGFYPDVSIVTGESWWTGLRPSASVSFKIHDRRLEPFFDRLARIERGEWDSELGRLPTARALTNARTVLTQLSGGAVTPKKIIGGDGLIALYFTTGAKYSTIEALNSGAMLLLNSDGRTPPQVERFRLSELPEIIDRIRAHIS